MTSMDLLLHHRLVEQYGLDLTSSNSSSIADRLVENMPSSGPRQTPAAGTKYLLASRL